jgi:hypothetical protein
LSLPELAPPVSALVRTRQSASLHEMYGCRITVLSGEVPTAKLDAVAASEGRRGVLFVEDERRALFWFRVCAYAVPARLRASRLSPLTMQPWHTHINLYAEHCTKTGASSVCHGCRRLRRLRLCRLRRIAGKDARANTCPVGMQQRTRRSASLPGTDAAYTPRGPLFVGGWAVCYNMKSNVSLIQRQP